MLPELSKETVRIKDRQRTEGIIENLLNGGSTRLQVQFDIVRCDKQFSVTPKRQLNVRFKITLSGLMDRLYLCCV